MKLPRKAVEEERAIARARAVTAEHAIEAAEQAKYDAALDQVRRHAMAEMRAQAVSETETLQQGLAAANDRAEQHVHVLRAQAEERHRELMAQVAESSDARARLIAEEAEEYSRRQAKTYREAVSYTHLTLPTTPYV